MASALLTTAIPDGQLVSRGKVRDVYATAEALILVATDRISAFDCVVPPGVPGRGVLLTRLSSFWFRRFADRIGNHLLATELEQLPEPYCRHPELAGRSVLVKRLEPIPIECVARGYLAGSGLKEYRASGRVCGVELPPGLRESDQLPKPIFTPATKETTGHDENISFDRMVSIVGGETAETLRQLTLDLYRQAARYAADRGIIIADTKLEFGWEKNQDRDRNRNRDRDRNRDGDQAIVWMDEAFTPDSSRFWPADSYQPGRSQPSFDKQYVRDWLEQSGWSKEPPAPALPPEVVEGTRERYREAYRLLTGDEIDLDLYST